MNKAISERRRRANSIFLLTRRAGRYCIFSWKLTRRCLLSHTTEGLHSFLGVVVEKITSKAILDVLKRISASGRRPIFHDLVEEFECADSPKPLGDALRALKDAGLVDFKEPFCADTVIEIIHVIE